jgi:hypothetical protein
MMGVCVEALPPGRLPGLLVSAHPWCRCRRGVKRRRSCQLWGSQEPTRGLVTPQPVITEYSFVLRDDALGDPCRRATSRPKLRSQNLGLDRSRNAVDRGAARGRGCRGWASARNRLEAWAEARGQEPWASITSPSAGRWSGAWGSGFHVWSPRSRVEGLTRPPRWSDTRPPSHLKACLRFGRPPSAGDGPGVAPIPHPEHLLRVGCQSEFVRAAGGPPREHT